MAGVRPFRSDCHPACHGKDVPTYSGVRFAPIHDGKSDGKKTDALLEEKRFAQVVAAHVGTGRSEIRKQGKDFTILKSAGYRP